ncbi:hypothetical protein B0H16DRAFT_1609422 [Mycena metata]|uniref:Vps72/YL1 C-terminal domain-containing protein n=1 Tax=Mycena metata TaxID=1033252 RepID=A0AAD7HEA2_9AGAR|nr:hypothetical protein B0H16DRAFT_1609422 [Mycena metata]
MDVDGEPSIEEEEVLTYTSIEAPPLLLPQKHYCDITGLEAPYTDPVTKLASPVKEYLAACGVNSIVK